MNRALAAAAPAVGVAAAAVALIAPAWASGGDTLRPPGRAPFVPKTGDWEGVSHGFRASFQLVVNPHNRIYRAAGYGIYDLTTSVPQRCPPEPGAFVAFAVGTAKYQLLVSPTGAFPFRQGQRVGAFTAANAATVSRESGRRCLRRLVWRLHPARRTPVAEGRWRITFADGERQSQVVTNGGRTTSMGLPNVTATCPSGPAPFAEGGVTVFIPASGHVDQTLQESGGGRLRLLWSFISRVGASGKFIASAPGCSPGTLTFNARLAK